MADIGQLVGTLLSSLAHARRIADEETAAIAEYYKDNPLLQGMSVPRIRVPQLVLDLPVLIQAHDEGKDPELQNEELIVRDVTKELSSLLKTHNVELSNELQEQFRQKIKVGLTQMRPTTGSRQRFQREHVIRVVDDSLAEVMKASGLDKELKPSQIKLIAANLRDTSKRIAFKNDGIPPKIEASIITAEVKEQAASSNVARLHITLREEGLEWDIIDNQDGTITRRLSPE